MKKRVFRDYQGKLLHDLQDPKLASAYLNEALLDEDPRIFELALQSVLKTQCNKTTLKALEDTENSINLIEAKNLKDLFKKLDI